MECSARFRFLSRCGFSLIEFIAILLILGTLAVIIVPRFIQLDTEAKQQNTGSVAAALSVVSANNFRLYKLGGASQAVGNCAGFIALMPSYQGFPAGYDIVAQAIPAGGRATCVVVYTDEPSITATFVGYAVP